MESFPSVGEEKRIFWQFLSEMISADGLLYSSFKEENHLVFLNKASIR